MKNSESYKIIYLIYCLILFCAFDLAAQDMTGKFDSIVQEFIGAPSEPGYAIQISQDGKTIYKKAFGRASLDQNIDLTPDHVFRIGSITKQFTALGILRLVEDGSLSLDDDIRKYVSDYPKTLSPITIHHLLAHTSGIPNHSSIPNFDKQFLDSNPVKPIQIINAFKHEETEFSAGEKGSYNNFGYVLLGHILEKVSGLSFGEFLEQEFFSTLNLDNTTYNHKGKKLKNLAVGYKKENDEFIRAKVLNPELAFSAGGICSTVGDITKWYNYINNLKLSKDESIKLALTHKTTNQNLATGYGYGWQLGKFRGRNYYGHDGIINGFNCETKFFEKDQLFIAVFSNSEGNGSVRLLQKISDELMKTHINLVEDSNKIDIASDNFSGMYQLRPDFVIEITHDEQKIFGSPNGQGKVELKPIGSNKFYVKEIEAEIEFKGDNLGKYNSFTLVQGGQANIALRIEQ